MKYKFIVVFALKGAIMKYKFIVVSSLKEPL